MNALMNVSFEILTVVSKMQGFWDVTFCLL